MQSSKLSECTYLEEDRTRFVLEYFSLTFKLVSLSLHCVCLSLSFCLSVSLSLGLSVSLSLGAVSLSLSLYRSPFSLFVFVSTSLSHTYHMAINDSGCGMLAHETGLSGSVPDNARMVSMVRPL